MSFAHLLLKILPCAEFIYEFPLSLWRYSYSACEAKDGLISQGVVWAQLAEASLPNEKVERS